MKFRIRVDLDEDQLDEYVGEWCKSRFKEYVIVHHRLPHGNPHYHMYVDDPMCMSTDAMRQRVKRYFKIVKRGDYSVQECSVGREDEYISYMWNTKHDNVVTYVDSNIDSERLAKCIQYAKEITDEFNAKVKNRKPKSLYEIAMYINEVNTDDSKIFHDITRILHQFCKCHDEHLIYKVFCTIQSKRDINVFVERVRRKLL